MLTLHARLISEADKLTAVAQTRQGRSQDTLRNCRDGSPASVQAISELQTTRDKIAWLQALKSFAPQHAAKVGLHERLPVALTANPTATETPL
jgi:hypothetical protein